MACRRCNWSKTRTFSPPSRSASTAAAAGDRLAAETEHLIDHATAKLQRKRCDWIVANDVVARDRRDGRRPQHRASVDPRGRRDPP
ncbi:MAG: phosphopantothenoylcysteine decarboxylase [Rhodopseudomonas palustris]|nr:phosphopantothenoylcysteine decarboxylase [Rhodopseudomonas palustris]